MDETSNAISDNLSDFSGKLMRVEATYIKEIGLDLAAARKALVGAAPGFKNSRMNFGRILRTYKHQFKAVRGWTAAVKVIAEAIGCDERTVDRIIEDYERASSLPALVIEAMEEQKINPAEAKNAPVIANLAQVPQSVTREEADEAVRIAIQYHVTQKKAAKKASSKPTETTVEEFAAHVVKLFERRYRNMPPEQRDADLRYVLEHVVNALRADIRELRHYGRPVLVPRPETRVAA